MTTRVRPITVMAGVAVVAVGLVAVFAWRHDDEAVVGHPAAMPLLLGADEATATTMAGSVTYVRGPDLTEPHGTQSAWVVAATPAEPAAVRRLADALGVTGDLRPVDGGWQIGFDDGPNVRVQGSAGLAWDYSSGAEPAVVAVCAEPAPATTFDPSGRVDGGGDSSTTTSMADPAGEGGCHSTPPPEGVPSAAEAEQATRALLQRAGLDVDHLDVSATSSDWTAVATASPELGGTPTQDLDTVVTFGGGGAITRAAGILAVPTRADTYPLIGVDAAIARLNAGRHVLDRFPRRPMPATDTAVSSPTQVPVSTFPATTVAPMEPSPACPVPSPAGPVTTTTLVGPDDGTSGGSGGSSAGCPGQVEPCPPCPSDAVCEDWCPTPSCDPAACPEPRPGPIVVPEPTDPTTPPDGAAGATVVLTSVEVVLAAVPGSDRALWLVPAYRFDADDGRSVTVLAVDDSFVDSFVADGPSSGPTPEPTPATEPATEPFPPITTGPAITGPPAVAEDECCAPTRPADGSIARCSDACAPGSSAPVTTSSR